MNLVLIHKSEDIFVSDSQLSYFLSYKRIFIDAQHIIYKLETKNKLNNLATMNIKPLNKPKGFLGQTTNTYSKVYTQYVQSLIKKQTADFLSRSSPFTEF